MFEEMNVSRLCRFVFGSRVFSGRSSHSFTRVSPSAILHHRSVFQSNACNRIYTGSASRDWKIKMSRFDKKGRQGYPNPAGNRSHASHGTRGAILEEEVKAEKEKYASMPIERKRKLYKCGEDKVLTLEDIAPWPQYESVTKKSKASSKKSFAYKVPKFAVNEDLNKKVSLLRADITALEIDAIVNAANNSLLGGGGVDGAIHIAAGSFLKRECSTLSGCSTGDAKITCGYKLPAKHVIHTVGPVGEVPKQLHSAYKRCLEVLKENQLTSVAFPCISTGIYGYPVENATHVAMHTIRQWLENDSYADKVERIILCVFLKKDVEVYEELFPIYFPLGSGAGDKSGDEVEEVDVTDSPKGKSADVSSSEKKDHSHTTTTTAATTTTTTTTATTTTTTTTAAAQKQTEEEPMETEVKEGEENELEKETEEKKSENKKEGEESEDKKEGEDEKKESSAAKAQGGEKRKASCDGETASSK